MKRSVEGAESEAQSTSKNFEGWWTRDRVSVLVFAILTVLCLWLCYRIAQPFLPALAWALALAIVTNPLHRRIERRVQKPGWAAAIAVALVVVAIIAPAAWVGQRIGREAGRLLQAVESGEAQKSWEGFLKQSPALERVQQWVQDQVGDPKPLQSSLVALRSFVTGSIGLLIGLLVTLFFLFFLFRDQRAALRLVRSLVPLSETETDEVFRQIGDSIHASIYGTISVAAIQGILGGLMFWWLGLPAPLLWGIVMALLSIVPVFGAFMIWLPAAIYLAVNGAWGKAVLLTAWGTVVIGLIDNLLYPIFVGDRLRLHTALVFVAILGGLELFGASGLILGPVVLALTQAVIEIWRRRTRGGRTAEAALDPH